MPIRKNLLSREDLIIRFLRKAKRKKYVIDADDIKHILKGDFRYVDDQYKYVSLARVAKFMENTVKKR